VEWKETIEIPKLLKDKEYKKAGGAGIRYL